MTIRRATALFMVLAMSVATPLPAEQTDGTGAATGQTLTFPVGGGGPGPDSAPGGQCIVTFGPRVPISAVAFSPDGKSLAVGGYREVLLWDLAAASLSKRIGVGQLSGRVGALAFVGNGPLLAVGDGVPAASGAVRIFDVGTGKLTATFDEPPDEVRCLAVSPDGQLLAAGGAYNPVHVWHVADSKLVHTIEGHSGWVAGVAFSPDGQLLATASADKTLQIWKVDGWEQTLRASNPGPLHSVAFNPDGRTVVVAVGGASEQGVRLWRTNNARWSRSVPIREGVPLAIQAPAKLRRVYIGCSDHALRTLTPWGGVQATFHGHTDWVYALAFSPDETRLASGGADGVVKLWNPANGKLRATLMQLAPGTDRWLIITSRGHVATSSPEAIAWKTKDGTAAPAEAIARFTNTEAVRKALAAVAGRQQPRFPRKAPARKPPAKGGDTRKQAP